MIENPRVTIIVPCYEQAEYLPKAVESALNQTVKCEVIIINDGSKDDTRKIAESYKLLGVKVINQVNKGLASARNSGIMAANSEFILPLDADDYLELNCVEVLLKKADETGADVVGPSMRTFGLAEQDTVLVPEPTLAQMRVGNHLPYCSLVRRDALIETGGYNPRMDLGFEDYHEWFDLLLRGKRIVTVPDILFHYRLKKESMYTKADKHRAELMLKIFNDFPESLPKEITSV